MPKAISQTKFTAVLAGLDKRDNYAKIRRTTGVSQSKISHIRAEHRPDLEMSMGGRPRKLSPATVRHAARLITYYNYVSVAQVAKALMSINGDRIHPITVRRALNVSESGVRALDKLKRPKPAAKVKCRRVHRKA
ncbi:hypothetical protein RSAG8_07598, partial [Rhizoctonia solani AG-8 WAC10335]